MKISKKITITVPADLLDDIEDEINRDIINQLKNTRENVLEKVKSIAVSYLKENPVYKAINGDFAGNVDGTDLQAEFGLSDELATRALSILEKVFAESFRLRSVDKENRNSLIIDLFIDFDEDYRDKLTSEPFQYDSISGFNGKETTIYWMAFLLEAANAVIDDYILGVENFGIQYEDAEDGRSHRAFMTSKEAQAEAFPYAINKSFVTFSGENFIEDLVGSREFKTVLGQILEKEIDRLDI